MLFSLALTFPLALGSRPAQDAPVLADAITHEHPHFSWCDFDNDGLLDLYVQDPGGEDRLLANRGEGRFEDVTALVGLAGLTATRLVLWQDCDGDGRLDLFVVSAARESRLFHNKVESFADATQDAGLAHALPDLDAEWIDYDRDGRPDLHVTGVRGERLYHNLSGGRFERIPIAIAPSANPALATSAPSTTTQAASNPAGSPAQSATSMIPQCYDTLRDQASPGNCLQASSVPALGMLMPLSSDLFVDASGKVGLGTLSPAARLDVSGGVKATSFTGDGAALTALNAGNLSTGTIGDARLSSNIALLAGAQSISGVKTFTAAPSFTSADAPFSVTSSTKVTNFNADTLDGFDSAAFLRSIPSPLTLSSVAAATALVTGVNSSATNGAIGVLGEVSATGATRSYGLVGRSRSLNGIGVYGEALATAAGNAYGGFFQCDAPNGFGAFARNTSPTSGYGGWFEIANPTGVGVAGIATSTSTAATNTSRGLYAATNSSGPNSYAALFDGRVHVNGTLSKAGGSFKIDHPLDPANKTLSHSFVESPDMMNVYNGNVTTDERGAATIALPEWFEALNKDFRYQLTVIDENQFAQVRVSHAIEHNRFSIRTDKPAIAVSWQVTGVRQDPWAEKNRIPVEEEKAGPMRGRYLAPEAYGLGREMGMSFMTGSRADAGGAKPEQR